jgi:hypothetical protein
VTEVTLLEKAYGSFSVKSFETVLLSLCEGLRVKVRVHGTVSRGWVQIDVSGEDEVVALRLLDREVGLAPVSAGGVGRFSVLRGKIIDSGRSSTDLFVDVGLLGSEFSGFFVPLWRLQAQLGDGEKVPLRRLIELFCLFDFVPVSVRIVSDLSRERRAFEAEFSDVQLSRFSGWLGSNLDRVIVLGARRKDVEWAIDRARLLRDIFRIETLGLLEHALLCKLGTDAVGLLPKLGPYLAASSLVPFSPRKIRQVIGRSVL